MQKVSDPTCYPVMHPQRVYLRVPPKPAGDRADMDPRSSAAALRHLKARHMINIHNNLRYEQESHQPWAPITPALAAHSRRGTLLTPAVPRY